MPRRNKKPLCSCVVQLAADITRDYEWASRKIIKSVLNEKKLFLFFFFFSMCSTCLTLADASVGVSKRWNAPWLGRFPVHIHRCRWVGDAVNSPVDEWAPCPCATTLLPAAAHIRICLSLCSLWFNEVWQVYVNMYVCISSPTQQIKTLDNVLGSPVCWLLCICVF